MVTEHTVRTVLFTLLCRVLKSNIPEYPSGSIVMFYGGWKTVNKIKKEEVWFRVDQILPEKHVSYSVGAVGMPG